MTLLGHSGQEQRLRQDVLGLSIRVTVLEFAIRQVNKMVGEVLATSERRLDVPFLMTQLKVIQNINCRALGDGD